MVDEFMWSTEREKIGCSARGYKYMYVFLHIYLTVERCGIYTMTVEQFLYYCMGVSLWSTCLSMT